MKYSALLLVLALTVCYCQEENTKASFLGTDGETDISEAFNTTALVDTVQEIMKEIQEFHEPIAEKLDAVLSWGGDTLQDMVKAIQEPLAQQIDNILTFVGSDSQTAQETVQSSESSETKSENEEMTQNSEEIIENDRKSLVQDAQEEALVDESVQTEVEKEVQQPAEEQASSTQDVPEAQREETTGGELIENQDVTAAVQEQVQKTEENIEATQEAPMPAQEDTPNNEIVVVLNLDDVLEAFGVSNTSSEDQPFYFKFFELFMGKETEVDAAAAPVFLTKEEQNKNDYKHDESMFVYA